MNKIPKFIWKGCFHFFSHSSFYLIVLTVPLGPRVSKSSPSDPAQGKQQPRVGYLWVQQPLLLSLLTGDCCRERRGSESSWCPPVGNEKKQKQNELLQFQLAHSQ